MKKRLTGAILIFALIISISFLSISLSWGTLNDTIQVYIPKVTLTEDPHDIAAETSWDQMDQEEQNCNLTISNEPPGDESLVMLGTTDEGTLTEEIDTEWIYTPLEESTTEKHPADFTTITVAAKIEGYEYTNTNFFVHSIFYYLAKSAWQPVDRTRAWQYAKWKYTIDTSALNSISYNSSQSTPGLTNAFNNCTLGTDAFGSENLCASVLGHENVHGTQSIAYRDWSTWSWSVGGINYSEVDAYNWEINNANITGLSSAELAEVTAWRDYFLRQGPHP